MFTRYAQTAVDFREARAKCTPRARARARFPPPPLGRRLRRPFRRNVAKYLIPNGARPGSPTFFGYDDIYAIVVRSVARLFILLRISSTDRPPVIPFLFPETTGG